MGERVYKVEFENMRIEYFPKDGDNTTAPVRYVPLADKDKYIRRAFIENSHDSSRLMASFDNKNRVLMRESDILAAIAAGFNVHSMKLVGCETGFLEGLKI